MEQGKLLDFVSVLVTIVYTDIASVRKSTLFMRVVSRMRILGSSVSLRN